MKKMHSLKPAMTLIEIIFVIIVLGVVASIGASIIAQTYKSYILQRAQYRANIKTEIALNQIANRLRYAIPGTIGARTTTSATFTPITEITGIAQRNVLQWVGEDGDSFEAISSSTNRKPGWSGFIDLNQSTINQLVSPGSNYALFNAIKNNLGGFSLTPRLYFPPGYGPTNSNGSISVTGGNGENFSVSGLSPGDTIAERYKLAWSSYAIVYDPNDKNLWLYYHFDPSVGADLSTASRSLLLPNVTTFSFQGSEGTMRIKICQYAYTDQNTSLQNDTVHSCKEKIIQY